MSTPNNESSGPNIDFDELLQDIQKNIGPKDTEPTNTAGLLPAELQPDEVPLEDRGQSDEGCLYCVNCKKAKLQYPAFPLHPHTLPLVQWINMFVAPTMELHKLCFACVLTWMYQYTDPTGPVTIVDKIIAEKLLNTYDQYRHLPINCIHERKPVEPAEEPEPRNQQQTNIENEEYPFGPQIPY